MKKSIWKTELGLVVKKFGWKTWLGVALLIGSMVMTFVAPATGLAESLPYNVLLSHLALDFVALDLIWSGRLSDKKKNNE